MNYRARLDATSEAVEAAALARINELEAALRKIERMVLIDPPHAGTWGEIAVLINAALLPDNVGAIRQAPPAAKPAGFLVHFEKVVGGMLHSDYLPNVRAGYRPIPDEDEAWNIAEKFAFETSLRCVNIYVVHSDNFVPVDGYRERMISNY